MIIKIDLNSDEPIHKQLEMKIKYGIITMDLKPHEKMPSIRELASDLGINMHTVHKVYKKLESENLIGKNIYGFYIKELCKKDNHSEQKGVVCNLLLNVLIRSEIWGIKKSEVLEIMNELYSKIEEERR